MSLPEKKGLFFFKFEAEDFKNKLLNGKNCASIKSATIQKLITSTGVRYTVYIEYKD